MTIYFDMDGTIADLYGIPDWLPRLRAYDPTPYLEARPLLNMSSLSRLLNRAQKNGKRIGIISWGSKNSTPAYDKAIARMKKAWLRLHLPMVDFDEIIVVPYGTRKSLYMQEGDILFDDINAIRTDWTAHKGSAYTPDNILTILRKIT